MRGEGIKMTTQDWTFELKEAAIESLQRLCDIVGYHFYWCELYMQANVYDGKCTCGMYDMRNAKYCLQKELNNQGKMIEFGICFNFDCEGELPTVFIATRNGTGIKYSEIFEEPILKSEVWSWNPENWEAGPIAKQLVAFMNSPIYRKESIKND